jgi:hypothetical protein
MKIVVYTLLVYLLLAVSASAQTVTDCPADRVCLTREQAIEYLTYRDENSALRKDAAVKDQAIADLQKLVADIKIDLARVSGEKSQLEADRVRWTAVIDILIKQSRPKKIGLINLF